MQWTSIDDEMPRLPGKYIVKTRTMMGNVLRFDARMHMTSYGKKTWDVSNQVVTHWVDEDQKKSVMMSKVNEQLNTACEIINELEHNASDAQKKKIEALYAEIKYTNELDDEMSILEEE